MNTATIINTLTIINALPVLHKFVCQRVMTLSGTWSVYDVFCNQRRCWLHMLLKPRRGIHLVIYLSLRIILFDFYFNLWLPEKLLVDSLLKNRSSFGWFGLWLLMLRIIILVIVIMTVKILQGYYGNLSSFSDLFYLQFQLWLPYPSLDQKAFASNDPNRREHFQEL